MSPADDPDAIGADGGDPTPEQIEAIYDGVSNWGRWGDDDELGALNLVTGAHRAAAAALVRTGRLVSLSRDLPVVPSADVPFPAHHHMLASGDALDATGIEGYEATRDYIGTDVHGLGVTHIDALCHMFVRGRSYNGRTPDTVASTGATAGTIMAVADGIVGRGVLLDVPRARGVEALAPGESIVVEDLEAAEELAGLRVEEGDLLLVGTGRDLGPAGSGAAGLHPSCLPWLHRRGVALLGSDGISDPMPSLGIAGWPFPIHQIGITRIGLLLIDNLRLATLSAACAQEGRWAFLLTVGPLRIPGGTGSPVNPVAVL